MYRTVLAAVNEHVNSEIAARYAKHLARAAGAKLMICSVREPGQQEHAFELAKEAAHRVQHAAREFGVEAECLFEAGDAAGRLRAIVADRGVDILFAAMRRREVHKRIAPGVHPGSRLLRLPCSVALVHVVHLGRISPRDILVPLKEHIEQIPERAEFLALLAKAFEARVHLLHAVRPLTRFFHGEMHLTPVQWEARTPPDIGRFIEHLEGAGVRHEKRLLPGSAGRSITIEASSHRRDLIVMGASERGLLGFLRGPDPVREVLAETPCNVIILKPER
jgi:nucleotide-binding universal stress UspA family protein